MPIQDNEQAFSTTVTFTSIDIYLRLQPGLQVTSDSAKVHIFTLPRNLDRHPFSYDKLIMPIMNSGKKRSLIFSLTVNHKVLLLTLGLTSNIQHIPQSQASHRIYTTTLRPPEQRQRYDLLLPTVERPNLNSFPSKM